MARRRAQSPTQDLQKNSHGRRKQTRSVSNVTESQQVLALGPLLKKRKTDDKDIDEFQTKVAAGQKTLDGVIEQRLRQAKEQNSRRKNELATALVNALQTPNGPPRGGTPKLGDSKISQNCIYTSVAGVLRGSASLIDEYDRLDKISTSMHDGAQTEISETWKKEIEQTSENLKKGARTALRRVQKVLGAEVQGAPVATSAVDTDVDEDMDEVELNYDLQKRLKYVERGLKRMVKGLDEEDLQGHGIAEDKAHRAAST